RPAAEVGVAAHACVEWVPAAARGAAAALLRAAEAAHEFLEDVFGREAARLRAAAPRPPGAAEAGEFGIAVGIDLAAVEGGLLFLVGKEVVGSRNLGELGVRLGIVLVLVGVIGLGQPAVGRLQVLLAHRTRNPEHAVWIAHG